MRNARQRRNSGVDVEDKKKGSESFRENTEHGFAGTQVRLHCISRDPGFGNIRHDYHIGNKCVMERQRKIKGQHNRSQHSPVLPALNEISIQRVVLLFRILSRLASRLSLGIEPSSGGINSLELDHHDTVGRRDEHRTCLIPCASRNGSIKSNIVVNCEKTIVFSTPSERSPIIFKRSKIFLILADTAGRLDFDVGSVALARGLHSLQYVESSPAGRL